MNLYEINSEITSLVDQETGEIMDFEKFEKLSLERETKLENMALWVKNLKADIVAFKAEKDAFAEREKQAKNKAEQLSEYLSDMLCGQAFKTSKVACSFRKSVAVDIVDENSFIDWAKANNTDFLSFKEPTVSKTEIKKALENGEQLDGVTLKENLNLQIK